MRSRSREHDRSPFHRPAYQQENHRGERQHMKSNNKCISSRCVFTEVNLFPASILSCLSTSAARSANSATRGREGRSADRAEDSYESVDNSYCGLVIQAQPMLG